MRTKLRGRFSLLFLAFAVMLAIPAIALADQLGNQVDDTLDATSEQISFVVGGSAKTVNLALFSQGSGPERQLTSPEGSNSQVEGGCNVGNLTDSEAIEVQAISSGSAASVKWADTGTDKVTFAACSDLQTRDLTVTPGSSAGTANVTFKITSANFTELASPNTGIWQEPDLSGRYDLNAAQFTVNVTPPPNTPPSVSVTGVIHGATYEKGTVPPAGCSVTDAEDTNEAANPVKDSSALDSYGLGLEAVTCSYTDGGGLSQTASATYNIVDTAKPVIAPHDPVSANATSPNGAVVDYTPPTANDAVYGPVDVTCLPASGSTFPFGDTTVTCSATDGSGNTQTSTFKVTVADKTAPNIAAHGDITGIQATGPDGAEATYTKPTATDNVDTSVTVDCLPASGTKFALGDTTVTCSAQDAAGNKATSNFKVTVVDTKGPDITNVPSDITEEATSPAGAPVTFIIPTANDAVDGNRTVSCSPDSGSVFPLGLTEVTCSASDASGNTSSEKFNVTVADTTAPEIASHEDVKAEATGPDGANVTYNTPNATDKVDTDVTVDCTPASGTKFDLGTTEVTCNATDNSGNKATPTTFNVTVADTTAPEIASHADVKAEATGPDGANVTYTSPGTTDAVDGNGTANCTPASGSKFDLGDTTVTCNATDAAGNKATPTTFKVTVEDTTKPELKLPANITEEATGPNGNAVTFNATASDLVSGSVNVDCSPASGDTFAITTTTVNCSATDAAGNKATGSFTVKVQDTTAPAIASHDPVNATATSANGATVNYTSPGTTDAVDGNGTANCSPASGTTFAVGSTTVTCNATDAAGNKATPTTFKVNVAYSWSNFLQPINVTGAQSVFKLGSTVPVKFNLTGASAGITDGTFYLKYIYLGAGDGLGEQEAVATTTATTGTEFRYSAGQYIYNWSTKSVSKPGNYELRVYSDAAGTVLLGKVAIEIKK